MKIGRYFQKYHFIFASKRYSWHEFSI